MTDVRSTQVAVEVITTGPTVDARSTQVVIEIITSVDEVPAPNSGAILLVGLQ